MGGSLPCLSRHLFSQVYFTEQKQLWAVPRLKCTINSSLG